MVSIRWKMWWPEHKTAKIQVRTPLQLDIYFWFMVSETRCRIRHISQAARPSSMQNVVKIRNELRA